MPLLDNSERYGQVTRLLHWVIALLILWQFLSAGAHFLLEDTSIEELIWPTHKPLGFLLFVLVIVRASWAITNLSRRPKSVNLGAKLGHLAIYVLLISVPTLALVRQYGSGKPFEPFGMPLMPGFGGEKIAWMVEAGNLLHGWLGWALFALILGHIFMAFWHRKSGAAEDVLPRMWR